ncbi:MAG: undecaprenyl-diphosphate phosphatase [bacterium]|nr:undecaprenyl-diphosphate phosphatase [bacterium]
MRSPDPTNGGVDVSLLWVAVVLGIVEGLTEFLPVSSTGHLVVTSEFLGFEGPRAEVFQIFIQLGAILAVVWEHRGKLAGITRDLPRSSEARHFAVVVPLAFIPSAVLGLLLFDAIFEYLFSPRVVASALIVGGLLILLVEGLHLKVRTRTMEAMTLPQALLVGLAQCLALWPGFSRSAATILGGLCVGLDRRTAAEFSFFLAIPTMIGAASYKLLDSFDLLSRSDVLWLALSFVISFFVGWWAVRWLLHFVSNHTFRSFAWYRIALGFLLLALFR